MKLTNGIVARKKNIPELPPGQLIYTGDFKEEPFRAEVYIYDSSGYERQVFEEEDNLVDYIKHANDSEKMCWVNVIGLNDLPAMETIGDWLNLSDLYLEDILKVTKHSKYNIEEEFIFTVMPMIYERSGNIYHENMSIVYKKEIVITFQETAGDVFGPIRRRIENREDILTNMHLSYLYYSLMDILVDNYMDVLRDLSLRIDELEEIILDEEELNMKSFYAVQKQLLLLRKTVFPLKDLITDIVNLSIGFEEELEPFMQDLGEHIEQLITDVVLQREMIKQLSDSNMSNMSTEMNEIMTTLTIFSAIFIPLSFLTGVFGMNFTKMPLLNEGQGFIIFIILCVLVSGSMIIFFKRRRWF